MQPLTHEFVVSCLRSLKDPPLAGLVTHEMILSIEAKRPLLRGCGSGKTDADVICASQSSLAEYSTRDSLAEALPLRESEARLAPIIREVT